MYSSTTLIEHGTRDVKKGDYCGKIAVEECGSSTICNDPPNEQTCPSICNAAKVCPILMPGQSIKYDCSLKGTFC